ncbi:hypothetical protein DYB30_010095, partial [Aphanomyces astaci]
HKKLKSRVFEVPSEELEAVEVKAKTKLDPSTSTRNWEVPLSNRYEIFTLEPDSNIPDFDLKVFLSPTTLGISPTVSKLLLKKLVSQFHVDNISKETLTSLVSEFCVQTLEDMQYGDNFLQTLQAQPTYFRPALANPGLEDYWISKATSHALCRLLSSTKPAAFKIDGRNLPIAQVLDVFCGLFEDELGDTLSPGAALDRLCSQETPDFSAQDHIQLVLWDLFAMISAPSIYFDPVKMAHASQTSLLVPRDQRSNYMRKWLCKIDDGVACDKTRQHSNDGFKTHVVSVHKLEWVRNGRETFGVKIDAPPLEDAPSNEDDAVYADSICRRYCVAKATLLLMMQIGRKVGVDPYELLSALDSLSRLLLMKSAVVHAAAVETKSKTSDSFHSTVFTR